METIDWFVITVEPVFSQVTNWHIITKTGKESETDFV